MKIENDKYYTPIELAKRLIKKTFEIIGVDNITEVVEPSAGNGSFSNQIENCIAYDLVPEDGSIIQADFLKLNLGYKKGRLFIGNPPFGVHNKLIHDFYDKCVECGDYIAFVLPISLYENDIMLYKFDLIYHEDLGLKRYTDRDLHCCFNIYKRPDSGQLNSKPNYELNEIKIIEYRRKNDGTTKYIPDGYCYAMCNWGNGCMGKVPNYIGEYAQEVYFYCDDDEIKRKIIDALEFDKVRGYAKSISSKRLSVMRIYKYLYESVDGLTLKNIKCETTQNEISLW